MIYTINTDAVDLGYINNTATVNASTINSTVVSDTSDDGIWALTWISPAEDEGAVYFWLAGNAVNGDGAPGDDDYWNMLSFTVNAPGTLAEDDSSATLETRTVSVGAYDALFLIEESPEKEEEERQKKTQNMTMGKQFIFLI